MLPKLIRPSHQTLGGFIREPDHERLLASWLDSQPDWQNFLLPHPDCFLVNDSRKAPSIEQIRAFLTELSFAPHQSSQKLFVIWRLDEASIPAQNALLKAFEEPPPYAQIVATVKNADQVLPTLRSRSTLEFVDLPSEQLGEGSEKETTHIKGFDWQTTCQKIGFDPLDLESFAKLALKEVLAAADVFSHRDEAIGFSQTYIIGLLEHQNHPSQSTLKSLKELEQAATYLRANCHVGLTMTNLMIRLWQTQIAFGKKG